MKKRRMSEIVRKKEADTNKMQLNMMKSRVFELVDENKKLRTETVTTPQVTQKHEPKESGGIFKFAICGGKGKEFKPPSPQVATACALMQKPSTVAASVEKQLGAYSANRSKKDFIDVRGPFQYFVDRATYQGQYLNSARHGFGRQIWSDGKIYEGDWRNDKMEGQGRLINTDGSIQEGTWLQGVAEGIGKFVDGSGTVYTGEWKKGYLDGKGKEVWPDGSVYDGQYRNNLKHGLGVFIWADGSKYNGQFNENNIEGRGVCTWPSGKRYEGDWRDGKMWGYGELNFEDGRIYKGNFKDDMMDGKGEMISANGKLKSVGTWIQDQQHGPAVHTENNITQNVMYNRGLLLRHLA